MKRNAIEERAAIIAVEVIANAVQVIEHKDAETLRGIKDYLIRELEKQRKADIEMACEWLKENYWTCSSRDEYVTDFRKYMEE